MKRVLIANRGEIAQRVIRACHSRGLESVAVYSTADATSAHVFAADRAVCIGPPPATQSYLAIDTLVHTALATGCDALHPGYGFLAERADLARRCAQNEIVFVGPPAAVLELSGDKIAARKLARAAGVPIVPGSDDALVDVAAGTAAAQEIGFPILLKARSGGGGRGMRVVHDPTAFAEAFHEAQREAEAAFGDGAMFMERFFANVRHIEVQVAADNHGAVRHYGERDCTIQRRHQKIVEEAPAVVLENTVRAAILEHSVAMTTAAGYRGAATVEFIYQPATREHFFIEMNARIQVEHPVTEQRYGVDLVGMQLDIAAGKVLDMTPLSSCADHVIEVRLNAEDARRQFAPSPGTVTKWRPNLAHDARLDSHVYAGYRVPPFYDSLLAKLIVSGASRDHAIGRTAEALRAFQVEGIHTTIPFLIEVMEHDDFAANRTHTRWIDEGLSA